MAEKIRVLYVDDESALLELGKQFLERFGDFTVTTAISAPEAIRMLEKERFDAIISDYQMPEMDGIEFVKVLRARGDKTPFIIFTGKGREEVVIQALNCGVDFYLQKGGESKAQFAELAHKIQRAVSLRQTRVALRESEIKFRDIFNSTTDAIHIHEMREDGTPGKFTEVNDVACRMLGYTREELLKKTPLDITTGYHSPPVETIFEKQRMTGSARFETGHRRKDGTIIPVEVNTHMVTLQGKNVMLAVVRDITERKASEQALIKSQIQLAEAMDLAHIVNWEFDVASGIFTFNDQFYALYGTTAEREGGYQMPAEVYAREFVHPDEVGVVADAVQNAINATDPNYTRQIEHRIIRRDGEIRHIIVRFGITKDARGITVKTHGANQDITDRKRAEEALRISHEKYTKVFLSAPDAITISELDSGRFIEVNDAATRIFGYSRDELIGKTALELGIWQNKENRDGFIDQIRKHGKVTQFEVLERRKSGELYNALVNADTISIGNVSYLIAIIRDITERKQVEEALRESEKRFRNLVEATSDWVWEVDENGHYTYVSPQALAILGYNPDELLGKTPFDLMPPAEAARVGEIFSKIVASQQPFSSLENNNLHKDGHIVILDTSGVPVFRPDGTFCGYRGIDRDITDRKKAEQEIARIANEWEVTFNTASDGICLIDANQNLIRCNTRMGEILGGMKSEDLAGKPCWAIVHKTTGPIPECPFVSAKKTLKRSRIEIAAGDLWFEVTADPILDSSGTFAGTVHIMRDITARKYAVEALERSYAILKGVVESPKEVVIFALDRQYRYIAFNENHRHTMKQIWGVDIALGNSMLEYIRGPDDRKKAIINFDRALSGESFTFIEAYGDTTLERRWYEDIYNPITDENGNVIGLTLFLTDITERKIAEEALILQNQIFGTIAEGVYLIRASDGTIVYTNSKFDTMFGYETGELIGKHVSVVNAPEEKTSPRDTAKEIIKALNKKGEWRGEIKNIRKDGTTFWCLAVVSTFEHPEFGTVWISAHTDITARKQAEEAVQAAVRLNQLIDTMSISDSMADTLDEAERLTNSKIGFFHFVNPDEQTIQLVTWSTETKKHCFIPKEPEWNYPVEKAGVWVDCLRERKPVIHNDYASLPHKKGLPKGHAPVIRELVVPIFDEDKIIAIIGVGNKATDYDERDINVLTLLAKNTWSLIQRKRAEEELRESRQILEAVLNTITVRVFWKDKNLVYLGCNTPFARDAGFDKPEDIIGKDDYAMGWREQAELYRGDDRAVIKSGKQKLLFEEPQTTPSGEKIYLLTSKVPLQDANGKIIGVLGTYLDITARKRAEEALQESEERYRVLFEESPISLFEEDFSDIKVWIDTKTNENIRNFRTWLESHREDVAGCAIMVKVTHINRATMALFGAASHKEFSEGLSAIFTKESYDAFKEEIIALAEGKNEFEGEVQIQTLNGERKTVLQKVTVVPGYEQTFSKILVSIIDISDLKRVEGALRQANKQLNILSSITRHDILNQLLALKGYLELSQDIIDNPEKLSEFINKEQHIANTIDRQITFTRDYQDLGVAAPAWQNVNASIKSAVMDLPMRDVHVDVDCSDLEVFVDRLFEKVFYNLIDNALKYGGEQMTTIRISSQESDTRLVIVCEDDGIGITDEDKKHLFTRGFGKHTGLGLFLCREILAVTGITITENSTPGKGARFEITVPKGMYRFTGTGGK